MKDLSVFALLIRNSFYKVLLVLILSLMAAGLGFYKLFWGNDSEIVFLSAEQMIDKLGAMPCFVMAFIVILLILGITESKLNQKSGNTIQRLRIDIKRFFVIETIYNVFIFTLLYAVWICAMIIMMKIYSCRYAVAGGLLTPAENAQQLFMAFYRNEFLHNLMPMAEIGKWIRNILVIVAFAMQAAEKDKKNYVADIWMSIYLIWILMSDIGINLTDMFADIIALILIAIGCLKAFNVFGEDGEDV